MDHSPIYWLRKWALEGYAETRDHGVAGAREGLLNAWRTAFLEANRRFVETIGNPGRPIYEPDWAVLVVLDACRTDLFEEVAPEYDFLPDAGVDTVRSRGSKTPDWMARNFTPDYAEEMAETAYIAGNPYSRELDGECFASFDEVWRYAWNDDLRTIPARPITDRAVATWRERGDETDRMIVHYMQPHAPFVHKSLDMGRDNADVPTAATEFGRGKGRLWKHAGYTIPVERVRAAIVDNLRHVLDDVALLLDNLDAESVVLTADHGNAVGEFEMWGHPSDLLLPCVRQVPWVEVRGADTGSYEPTTRPDERAETDESEVQDRLHALGYR